jgi:putative transposase
MRKLGKKAGFPRFKSFDRMKSLNYPQSGFWLNKKLKVTPFGELTIKQHRQIQGKIKTLTLKIEPTGKWYGIFAVEEEKKQPKINKGGKIGIDLGLKTFATLSNGEKINNPRHFRKVEAKLAIAQRKQSRKTKGSANRRKARLKVAILHERTANTRADFLHKESTKLVNNYSFIALEKIASKEMAEQNYGKSINDAGWNMFANMLDYKAESAGCEVVFVDARNTTKMCSDCGTLVPKDLTERVHNCPSCGLKMDRDLNASINILNRATAGIAESNASGDEPLGSSLKEEGGYCKYR